MSLAPGTRLGRYEIRSKIGAGGMGEVYLAEDTKLHRRVALKFLPVDSVANEQANKRLLREAQAAAKLDHPNICAVYEVGEEKGRSFIVMPYVEGETLDVRMKRMPLDVSESLTIAAQVADALSEAHTRGIIHRDIKPQNIIITARGQAKVMDFGIAKVTTKREAIDTEALTQNFLTEPGTVMGTAPYMSPEQLRGEPLDSRSDIFSFGAVFYEMLTGRQPFAAESVAATAAAILTREPLPITRYSPETSAELQRIITKALRKDRDERYQTINDLLVDLKGLRGDLEQNSGTVKVRESTHKRPAKSVGRGKAIDSLAILPLANASADPGMEYLSDGITESIINSLSQLPKLKVMARSTVFRYKGRDVDPLQVGGELGVRAVLTGRVRKLEERLVIGTELVDVTDGSQLWGEQYHRQLADVFALQEEISQQISEKLRLKLSGAEKKRLMKRPTRNTEAYELYLKGRFFWNKRTEDDANRGIEYFQRALGLDPNFALAYTGLADCQILLGDVGVQALLPKEAFFRGQASAARALELDDALAEAHGTMGHVSMHLFDWPRAEKELRRAIELNPNYAQACLWNAYYLSFTGQFDESIAAMNCALQLDPLSLPVNASAGELLYFAGRFDESIKQFQKAIEMDAHFTNAHLELARVYEESEMYDAAIAEFAKSRELAHDSPESLASLAHFYAVSGGTDGARALLQELIEMSERRYVSPSDLALIHGALGEKDQAFEWLDRAYEIRDGWLIYITVDPRWKDLRDDERFARAVQRVGLRLQD